MTWHDMTCNENRNGNKNKSENGNETENHNGHNKLRTFILNGRLPPKNNFDFDDSVYVLKMTHKLIVYNYEYSFDKKIPTDPGVLWYHSNIVPQYFLKKMLSDKTCPAQSTPIFLVRGFEKIKQNDRWPSRPTFSQPISSQ